MFSSSSSLFSSSVPALLGKLTEKNVRIAFFSGTGNTLIVSKKMQETLEKFGKNVEIFPLEKIKPSEFLGDASRFQDTAYCVASPVSCWSVYPNVWNFMDELQPKRLINPNDKTHKKPKFIFTLTQGGTNLGLMGPVKHKMRKQGFEPFAAQSFNMQSNLFMLAPKEKEEMLKVEARKNVEKMVQDMIDGKAEWKYSKTMYLPSSLLVKMSRTKLMYKAVTGQMYTDESLCNGCQVCVGMCPTKALKAVKLEKPEKTKTGKPKLFKIVKDRSNCVCCLRCKSYCPEQAIFASKISKQYRGVDIKEMQHATRCPTKL